MEKIATLHMRLAVVYALLGMGLGLAMAISGDYSLHPAHAHLNLVGFVICFLYGLYLRAYAGVPAGKLAWVQFGFAHVGAVVMSVGIAVIYGVSDELGHMIAPPGAIMAMLGMALFAVMVFRGRPA